MKNPGNLFVSFITIFFVFAVSLKAEPTFTTSIDGDSYVGERTILKISISGADEAAPSEIPKVDGLNIGFLGPMTVMQWTNGKRWSGIVLQFSIVPTKEGKFTVPGIKFTADGKTYMSDAVRIDARKGGVRKSRDPFSFFEEEDDIPQSQREMEIKTLVEVSQKNFYVGEPVLVRYYILSESDSDIDVKGYSRLPVSTGLVRKDIEEKNKSTELVDGGKKMLKQLWKSFVVVSPSAGNIKLEGGEIVASVPIQRSILAFEYNKSVPLNDVELNFINTPEKGKPLDYSGNVGSFSVSADQSLFKTEVMKEVSFKLKVSGSGNFYTLSKPMISSESKGMRIIMKENDPVVQIDGMTVKGEKIYDVTAVPEESGQFSLVFQMNFFDPVKKDYSLVKSLPVEIKVDKGDTVAKVSSIRSTEKTSERKTGMIIGISIVSVLLVALIFLRLSNIERKKNRPVKESENLEKSDIVENTELPDHVYDELFLKKINEAFSSSNRKDFLNISESAIKYLENEKKNLRSDEKAVLAGIKEDLSKARYGGGKVDIELLQRLRQEMQKMLRK